MINPLFIFVLLLETACTVIVIFSLLQPARRIWPPQQGKSFSGTVMLLLFNFTGAGIIALGVLDWGRAAFPIWIRPVGGLFWLSGMILAVRAIMILGVKNTSGNSSGLVISGPYRWTRNPQYLGFMASLIGWGLMTNSLLTMVAGLGSCLPLLLVPQAEEPWLLERYGQAYTEYLEKTPRFLLLKETT